MNALIILANGFEEGEALIPYDYLSRVKVDVTLAAVKDIDDTPLQNTDGFVVTSSHNIKINVDKCLKCVSKEEFDVVIIPGGKRGAKNIIKSELAKNIILNHFNKGKLIASICASPSVVLYPLGIFQNNKGVCYTGFDMNKECLSSNNGTNGVCVSNNIITAQSVAKVQEFSFEIIKKLFNEESVENLKKEIMYY